MIRSGSRFEGRVVSEHFSSKGLSFLKSQSLEFVVHCCCLTLIQLHLSLKSHVGVLGEIKETVYVRTGVVDLV